MSEKGHLLLAVVTDICDDDVTYPSCHVCCGKLFLDHQSSDQRFCCLKCSGSCQPNRVQRRYRLVLTVTDGEVTGRVVVFGRTLDNFFGKTATDFHRSLSDLGKSGYPAEAMLSEALIKTFHGKYFYFGFKTAQHSGVCGPIALKDCLNIKISTECSQNEAPHGKEASHTLVYQMVPSNDGVYATVTDHMRYAVKTLKTSRKEGLLQEPLSVDRVQTEIPILHKNLSSFTESDFENSSHSVSKSLYSKQLSIMFSFENETFDQNSREIHSSDRSKLSCNDFNSWKSVNSQNQSSVVRGIKTHGLNEKGDIESSEAMCLSPLGQYPVTQKLDFSIESEPYIADHIENKVVHDYQSFVSPITVVEHDELAISKDLSNPSLSVCLKTSNQRDRMDAEESVDHKTLQIKGDNNVTVQTLYLPESEDLEAFLDTFEDDSVELTNAKNNSSTVSQQDVVTAKICDSIDLETMACDSNVHFVHTSEGVVQQTEEDCCYDAACEDSENIVVELCSQGISSNTVDTIGLTPPMVFKELYLPDSEDIEQFLNSFEEGVSCQFPNVHNAVIEGKHIPAHNINEKNPNVNPEKMLNWTIITESHEKDRQGEVVISPNILTLQDNFNNGIKLIPGNLIFPMNENSDEAKSYVHIVEDDSGFCQNGEFDVGNIEMKTKCASKKQYQEMEHTPLREIRSEIKHLGATKEWDSYHDDGNYLQDISHTGMKELVISTDMSLESQLMSLETIQNVVDSTPKTNLHLNDSKELEVFFADISLENAIASSSAQPSHKLKPSEHFCLEQPLAEERKREWCTSTCGGRPEEIVISEPNTLELSSDRSFRRDKRQLKNYKNIDHRNEDKIISTCSTYEELKENNSYHSGNLCLSTDSKAEYGDKGIHSTFEESLFNSSGDLFDNSFICSGKPEHIETDYNPIQNCNSVCNCSPADHTDSLSYENVKIITESQDIVELKPQALRCAHKIDSNVTLDSTKTCIVASAAFPQTEYTFLLGKHVQFEERLQKVTSCHLLDIKMKRYESPVDKLKLEFPLKSCLKSREEVTAKFRDIQSDMNTRTRSETSKHPDDIDDSYLQVENSEVQVENSEARTESDTDMSVIGGSQDLFGPSPITPVLSTQTWNKHDSICSFHNDNLIPCSTIIPLKSKGISECFQISYQTDSPDLFETPNEMSQLKQKSIYDPVLTPDLFSPAGITTQAETIPSEKYALEKGRNNSFICVTSSNTKCSGKRMSNLNKPVKKNHTGMYLVENTPDIRMNKQIIKKELGSTDLIRETVANYEDSPDLFESPANTIGTSNSSGLQYLKVLSKSSELCKQLFF